MTICRYFLQGYCRFGDRCRFEHTDPDSTYQEENPKRSNYSNRGSYNDGYNRRNYNAYDNRSSYNSDRRNEYTPHEDRYQPNYNQYNQRYTSERRYQSERYGPGTYESDSSYECALNLKTVQGTHSIHQVVSIKPEEFLYCDVSVKKNKICTCFTPLTNVVQKETKSKESKQKRSKKKIYSGESDDTSTSSVDFSNNSGPSGCDAKDKLQVRPGVYVLVNVFGDY
ncbi:hypothetical protein AVEN_110823-1 [Araneus ventricosus]|uniref:C3H1-type domain-containing protein n=1 Tax=Araneus ventricosus TaxID=182803 RepID=A0A4Y2SJG2_ARAVE|nr:hypothetical protein AVEN_110823-1 [Araneus ventricosus]